MRNDDARMTLDLFSSAERGRVARETLGPGITLLRGFALADSETLRDDI